MSQTTTIELLPRTTFSNMLPSAVGVGTINGDVLTILSVTSGTFGVGQQIKGVNVSVNTTITGYLTGVGGVGTYSVIPGTSDVTIPTGIKSSGLASSYGVVGARQPASSYYLGCKDLQTVNISTTGFTGTVIVEASLFTDPSSSAVEPSNWFEVYKLQATAIGIPGSGEVKNANTDLGVNINGSYVWLRARIQDFSSGTVNWVKVSY